MKNINEITANKCVVGATYFATGEYYDDRTGKSIINTPVVFSGRDRSVLFSGGMGDFGGQYIFKTAKGEQLNAYAKTVFFIKPIILE